MQRKSKFVYDAEDAAGLVIIPAEGLPPPDDPRSLKGMRERAYRKILLAEPHMKPLGHLVEALRAEDRGYVPDLDPRDGGTRARLLFLLEKPGPMTDPSRPGSAGSGFISRDNDDSTAAAVFVFMQLARIPREETLLWNVIPWWNGEIRVGKQEWRDGIARLEALLDILPRLLGVVLVGRKAARAEAAILARGLPVWKTAHPSPRVRARYPALFSAIPQTWTEARQATLDLAER